MIRAAQGWPGVAPRGAPGRKLAVGTAVSRSSRVWFSLSNDGPDQLFFPRPDLPRTVVLETELVEPARSFAWHGAVTMCDAGVLAYEQNAAFAGGRAVRFMCTHPALDAFLQRIVLVSDVRDCAARVRLVPQFAPGERIRSAMYIDYGDSAMLVAEGEGIAVAIGGVPAFTSGAVSYISEDEPAKPGQFAADGYVALEGSAGFSSEGLTLAVGFGSSAAEAAFTARRALATPFQEVWSAYRAQWKAWQDGRWRPNAGGEVERLHAISAATLRTFEAKSPPGGRIASLATPWGESRENAWYGTYHQVWTRDLVEACGGLLAAGMHDEISSSLEFLRTSQDPDGGWPVNMWLDGRRHWPSTELDEVALPVLLVDTARRCRAIDDEQLHSFWPLVRAAVDKLMRHGVRTPRDRWEDEAGYSVFTMAVSTAALVVAASMSSDDAEARLLLDTADCWNELIDRLLFVRDDDIARKHGIAGYYRRTRHVRSRSSAGGRSGDHEDGSRDSSGLTSPDVWALVRFGLRSANDPKIVDTVRLIDDLLQAKLPQGPCWYRYLHDGYGEHRDGSAFDGTGVGRPWPLLVGERAHYELAAGRRDVAERLRTAMAAFATPLGFLPEQVWDVGQTGRRSRVLGSPTHSATPLGWAHAEFLKLCRSLSDGEVFDTPAVVRKRYREP